MVLVLVMVIIFGIIRFNNVNIITDVLGRDHVILKHIKIRVLVIVVLLVLIVYMGQEIRDVDYKTHAVSEDFLEEVLVKHIIYLWECQVVKHLEPHLI